MKSRLEKLRETLRLEWGELAQHLEISRSMLDQVRSGARSPSFKLQDRIERAEVDAGLRASAPLRAPLIAREESPGYGAEVPTVGKMRGADFQELEKRVAGAMLELKEIQNVIRRMQS